jgi:ribulose-phosphate 3-epimerase
MLKQIIAPSVLNANFLELGNGLKAIENGGAGLVHLDIMDGHFVPNISFGPGISACVGKGTKLPLDCHLMIENPENYVGEFAKAGASPSVCMPRPQTTSTVCCTRSRNSA